MSSEKTIRLEKSNIFQRKTLVLGDVNFEIGKGEFVYLIGKTGTGKSSLLKTLYGELKLKEGEGSVAGYDLSKLKKRQIPHLRRKIGIVFQDFQLLMDRSVNENLKFVLRATGWRSKKKMLEKMQEVLEKVNLGTKGFKMPHQLSGGEQQRVAIARALLNDPEIILADEPTGNLDPETSSEIMELLFDICKNERTVLMATHDYTIIEKFPSRALRTKDSKVFALDPVTKFNPIQPIINPSEE